MISNVRKNRKDNDKKHRYQIFNRIFMEYQNSTEDIEVVKLINIRNYRKCIGFVFDDMVVDREYLYSAESYYFKTLNSMLGLGKLTYDEKKL